MANESDERQRPPVPPAGTLAWDREARLFATRRDLSERLREQTRILRLAANDFLRLQPPCDLVVRRGNLRISELLADGREVTRAVLQAGAVCRAREESAAAVGESAASPLYSLARSVLMALGETEVWQLPAGALDDV